MNILLFCLACWIFPPLGAAVTAIVGFVWLLMQILAVTTATAAVVAAVIVISYEAIKSWYEARSITGDTVTAFKKELGNHVEVTIGIYNRQGALKDSKVFPGNELSPDMKAKFAGRDKIVLKG